MDELGIEVSRGLEYVDRLRARSAVENVADGRELLRGTQASIGQGTPSVKS